MLRLLPMLLVITGFVLASASCKTTSRSEHSAIASLAESDNSNYLVEAAGRAKAYIDHLIQERNKFARDNGLDAQFQIVDARDRRLYPPGAAVQPNTPAEKALIKHDSAGRFIVLAWIQDRPGFYRFKEANGNRIIDIKYSVESIEYGSRFDGKYASVNRNTAGNGWRYIYYVKGSGNQITPHAFDIAVANFLQNAVLYMTPL